jgi:hypothetical protein
MTKSKSQKQSQRNNVTGSKHAPVGMATKLAAAPSQDLIRERAFELYEGRGKEHGGDKQDWRRAEQEIVGR